MSRCALTLQDDPAKDVAASMSEGLALHSLTLAATTH
jgi:hypothetical protein